MRIRTGTARLLTLLAILALSAPGCGDRRPPAAPRRSPVPRSPAAATPAPGRETASPPAAPARPPPEPPSPGPHPPSLPAPQPAERPGALRPSAPGRYRFDESGSFRTGGCVDSERPAPSPTSFVVEAPDGARQRSVRDRRDSDGQGSVAVAILEYRADGIYLVSLHQSQTTVLGSFEVAFEPPAPPLILPASPETGQRWSYVLTSTDGKVTVHVDTVVEATGEAVTLGDGTPREALRLLAVTRTTGVTPQGSLDLDETSRVWVSIEHRMILKEVGDSKGRAGLCRLGSHVETLLRSTTPE